MTEKIKVQIAKEVADHYYEIDFEFFAQVCDPDGECEIFKFHYAIPQESLVELIEVMVQEFIDQGDYESKEVIRYYSDTLYYDIEQLAISKAKDIIAEMRGDDDDDDFDDFDDHDDDDDIDDDFDDEDDDSDFEELDEDEYDSDEEDLGFELDWHMPFDIIDFVVDICKKYKNELNIYSRFDDKEDYYFITRNSK